MVEKKQKLFTDFAPITTEEWEAKINADLKGRDYERALVWKTYEGFNVRPYYQEENLKLVYCNPVFIEWFNIQQPGSLLDETIVSLKKT